MQGFNISQFSNHLNRYGTIQTNKFLVYIPSPIMFGPSATDEVILYRANSVRVPGINYDLFQTYRYGVGPQLKYPTNVNFSDVTVNFTETGQTALWKHFKRWMANIFDFVGTSGGSQPSYKTEYKRYYQTNIGILICNNEGKLITTVVLKEAYPVSLSDVNLSWGENNKLYEFSVRFTFREWYYDGYSMEDFQSGAVLSPYRTSEVAPQVTESPRPQGPTGVNDPVYNNGVQEGFVGLTGETVPTPVYQPGA